MDLTKILKPGDKVWTIQWGESVVHRIDEGETYPIKVMCCKSGRTSRYTPEGLYCFGDKHPSLFLKEQVFDISVPEPVFEQDELVWAKLRENYWVPAYYDMNGGPEGGHWVFEHQQPLKKSGAGKSFRPEEVRKWEDSPFKPEN